MMSRIPVIALAAGLLLCACRGESSKPTQAPAAVAAAAPPADTSAAQAAPAAAPRRVCTVENSATANEPFGAELTVSGLLNNGARITRREPIENNHSPGQIDTLLTLTHGANRFTFYRSPDNDLLTEASVAGFEAPYGRLLKTRVMQAQKLSTRCDSLVIEDSLHLNTVTASLAQGQLRRVVVSPYFD